MASRHGRRHRPDPRRRHRLLCRPNTTCRRGIDGHADLARRAAAACRRRRRVVSLLTEKDRRRAARRRRAAAAGRGERRRRLQQHRRARVPRARRGRHQHAGRAHRRHGRHRDGADPDVDPPAGRGRARRSAAASRGSGACSTCSARRSRAAASASSAWARSAPRSPAGPRAFGMTDRATRTGGAIERRRWPPSSAASGSTLDELLATSDVVSLHCPYSPETHHLIGAAQLGGDAQPRVPDQHRARARRRRSRARRRARRTAQIAGAGLDVFENEPTVHPALLELDNVVLIPHLGLGDGRDAHGDGDARRGATCWPCSAASRRSTPISA